MLPETAHQYGFGRGLEPKNAACSAYPLHHDLRSDNMCIGADGVRIIDWNWATIGNAELDFAFFLNAVNSEGGPPQETYFPDAPEQAAVVSGFFGSQCIKPAIPTAPHVRTVQRRQFLAAFAWVTRALDLPPPS